MAFCALGTVLSYESAPDTFTPIAQVTNIQRTGAKRDTDDTTNLDSPDGYREFIATVKSGGVFQLDMNFAPADAGQGALTDLFESGDVTNFKITLNDELGDMTFAGIVTEYGNRQLPTDKKATDSVKITVTGKVTDDFAS